MNACIYLLNMVSVLNDQVMCMHLPFCGFMFLMIVYMPQFILRDVLACKPVRRLGVGTGADPGFNATTTHQQSPNYHPFQQHL
jgi:hypothetical protein